MAVMLACFWPFLAFFWNQKNVDSQSRPADPLSPQSSANRDEKNMFGGANGAVWDDGSHNFVRKISVVYSSKCIYSISVVYGDEKGAQVEKKTHGGEAIQGLTDTITIELKYPRELVTNVSGHYSPVVDGGSPVVRSLTIKSKEKSPFWPFGKSKEKTYGPYGVATGTSFSFPEGRANANILGFKGRSDNRHLTAIWGHSEVSWTEKVKGMLY